MILNIGRDTNGNKILKVTFRDKTRGFSIQTNGALPETHRMTQDTFINHIAEGELNQYVKTYGTKRQKELLGW
jgi:16S rRNA C1402 N4-methylase RsmH